MDYCRSEPQMMDVLQVWTTDDGCNAGLNHRRWMYCRSEPQMMDVLQVWTTDDGCTAGLNTVGTERRSDERKTSQIRHKPKLRNPLENTGQTCPKGGTARQYLWVSSRNEILPLMGSYRLQGLLACKQKAAEYEFMQKWLDTTKEITRVIICLLHAAEPFLRS